MKKIQLKTVVDAGKAKLEVAREYVIDRGPEIATLGVTVALYLLVKKELDMQNFDRYSQRHAIDRAECEGLAYRHFPGVGVLTYSQPFFESDEDYKKRAANYLSVPGPEYYEGHHVVEE